MTILEAVHYFTTITIFTISFVILYLRFTTANVKLSAGTCKVRGNNAEIICECYGQV